MFFLLTIGPAQGLGNLGLLGYGKFNYLTT